MDNQNPNKYPARGWLLPYLLLGDKYFGNNRWGYWFETIRQGRVLPHDIPLLGVTVPTHQQVEQAVEDRKEEVKQEGSKKQHTADKSGQLLLFNFD